MSTLASLLALAAAIFAGLWVIKHIDQRTKDSKRRTYRVIFPRELEAEAVTAWIRSISGTLRFGTVRLQGTPTIVFEVWASAAGITHRIKLPWQHADYIIGQLHSLVPGIDVRPENDYPPRTLWTKAVELGLTYSSRTLRIFSAADMSASLLASVQGLETGEHILKQWVVTPAIPTHAPVYRQAQSHHVSWRTLTKDNLASRDEVNDRRLKLSEPNMLAVLRIAAKAETKPRAAYLIHNVRASLAAARSPSTRFVRRLFPPKILQRRIDQADGAVIFGMQLAAPELAALIAWPIGNPFVFGLPPRLARHLMVSESVPREGRVIGRSNVPARVRPIAQPYADAVKHMYCCGPTGAGKTSLLANMLRQDVANNFGVVLIENKGDLFHQALDYIPASRIDDVRVLDVTDTARPVGFNILNQGDPRVVIDELTALFDYLYGDSRSVWTREVMYHGLRTLVTDPKNTFIDLAPLLVPMNDVEYAWRDDLIRELKDRELRNFWQRFENQPRAAQDRITQPVMDRIWQLNARPEIRHIIGQSESSFQMTDVVANNQILLVNLSGLARDTASLTGTLLMNSLWHAVKSTHGERPTYLYMDEFQDFLNLPIDPQDMLAKARSFGLGMVLAHQHLGQLSTDMRGAIMANARSKLIFQTSADDARALAREFGDAVKDDDFMHLGKHEAIARVSTGEGVSPPFTLVTNPPALGYGKAKAVRYVSRQNYGRDAQKVEQEIEARRAPAGPPKRKRPTIGGPGSWGH